MNLVAVIEGPPDTPFEGISINACTFLYQSDRVLNYIIQEAHLR